MSAAASGSRRKRRASSAAATASPAERRSSSHGGAGASVAPVADPPTLVPVAPPAAGDWFKAAKSAIESGHITAAMRCYEKAFDLDPTLPIPEGGLVMKKIRGDAEYTDDELRSMKVDTKGPDEYTPDTTGDESGENPSDGGSTEANPETDGGKNGDKKEAPKKEDAAKPEGAEKPEEAGTPEPSTEKPAPENP